VLADLDECVQSHGSILEPVVRAPGTIGMLPLDVDGARLAGDCREPERPGRVNLDQACLEPQRLQERVPGARIDEPRLAVQDDAQGKMLVRRPEAAGRPEPPGQQHDVEPQLVQQPREGAVELEAEPAAPALDDLRDEHRRIQHDRFTAQDARVLERDSLQVRPLQDTQALDRRHRRRVEPESPQIREGVHPSSLPAPSSWRGNDQLRPRARTSSIRPWRKARSGPFVANARARS